MKTSNQGIAELYSSYGFEYRPEFSGKDYLVFCITQGVFDNSIIVKLRSDVSIEKPIEQLSQIGYQVKIEDFLSLKDTEQSLFHGFFSVKRTKAAFEKDYLHHIKNVRQAFPVDNADYSYFQSPFSKDSNDYQADDNILEHIKNEVNSNGPKLILIEAAAGFGKTCTAYEIGRIISEQDDEHIVLFAELSRDRQAKIFSHVLHKELARSFPVVSSELVVREIKKGKVIVVLDGFDELLNEKEDEKFQFEKSQAMLETIGKILENNAKVILTTRKTAILQGDDFDEWISSHIDNFEFTRFSLKEPSARSWLGNDRYEKLRLSRVIVKNISNPVLLTFLRFVDDEQFDKILKTPDKIVDKYFELLLHREKSRQELNMEIEEQSDIMRRLAQYMIRKNFTRDTKDNILDYFSKNEVEKIEEVRARYYGENIPSFESILEKLSNHALLDRSSIDEKIGFINNFVLGHFVAFDVMEDDNEWLADSIFVEAAANAYSARTIEARLNIWSKLQHSLEFFSDEDRVRLELRLLDKASGYYSGSSFNEILFDTKEFFHNGELTNCHFNECIFSNCELDFSKIRKSRFIHCSFYNCTTVGINNSNEFISCKADGKMQELVSRLIENESSFAEKPNDENNIKSYILEKFWPKGKETIAFAHRPMLILYRGAIYPSQDITEAIDDMKKAGLLIPAKRKNWIGLDISGSNFSTIKNILGR